METDSFKSFASVVWQDQNRHRHSWERIVSIVEANRHVFEAYVMSGTFEQHIATMRRDGAWGTQVEMHAAASLYQLPLYICSPHPSTHQYRWSPHCCNVLLKCSWRYICLKHMPISLHEGYDSFPNMPVPILISTSPTIIFLFLSCMARYRSTGLKPEDLHRGSFCFCKGKISVIFYKCYI